MERWMSFGRFDDNDLEFVGQTEADAAAVADASELKKVNDGSGNPKYGSFDSTESDLTQSQENKSRDLVGQYLFSLSPKHCSYTCVSPHRWLY